MIFQSLPVLWQTWSFTHTWREWINCQLQERVYLSQNVTSVTWTWQSALYSDTRRLYTNWILESRFSVQNVKSYFKAGTDLSCTEQKATHWVHLTIQCFPVQNATTSQIQRRTWAFTKRGCTQQDQAWVCMAGACKEKPRSFLNQHQHQKHQQDHANVNCSVRNISFSAKRNLKRHMKTVHKAVEMDVSRNSNNSNPDNNLNEQDEIINNATFLMDPLLWLAFNLPTFMDYLYKISTMIKMNWHFDI